MPVLRIVFFVLFILLQALPVFSAPVRVSDTDYRSFRTLTLDTGLTVLLVQDERAAKAAAAIALPIGNLDDPDSQLGLAHYLEHMLFLGSASYPDQRNTSLSSTATEDGPTRPRVTRSRPT